MSLSMLLAVGEVALPMIFACIYIYILLIIYTGEVYMLHLYIHIVVHRVNDGVEHR